MPRALKSTETTQQHDETRSVDGSLRPNWQGLIDALDAMQPGQIQRRQADIAKQLRANGIAYSPLSEADSSPRPWNLDLAPFLLEPTDWTALQAGLAQRAQLKQAMLSDIYGKQSLLREGLIPPAMVYAHRNYLRDAVKLDSEMTLPLYNADVSRSPSGDWYVVDDICQYPAGIGYALENRLVLSRTLPRLFRQSRVLRIASYFKSLQQYIAQLSEADGRCVMLAPGPSHPHYFEYAFLAKYLGYTLVQAGDLTIRNNLAFLKTVSGMQRVSIIIRFIKDTELDPLTVGYSGNQGVTGLIQAVRAGGVKVINPIGAGVLNNPAFNVLLPQLCQSLLGEPLQLKSPPTYWLGNDKHLAHVNQYFQNLLFRNIDAGGQLFDPNHMSDLDEQKLRDRIQRNPHRYVAQERIDRSLAPSFVGDQRVLQQVTLRLYFVKQDEQYNAMPGALCLLDSAENGRRPDFDSLIGSKDTWVIANGPIKPVTLLQNQSADISYAMLDGELPSRAAENLFWMGRNVERCENAARLLRAVFQALQNQDLQAGNGEHSIALTALLKATTAATSTKPGFVGRDANRRLRSPEKELISLLHDPDRFGTLPSALSNLQHSASVIRDRISDELLQVLNKIDDIYTGLVEDAYSPQMFDDPEVLEKISNTLNDTLLYLSAFAGLAHENLTHGDGWQFMMMGRRLERITHTSTIINTMLSKEHGNSDLLEALLNLFDSTMTYRSRYRSQIDSRLVLQLLLLDENNPRSLAFQFSAIDDAIAHLPGRRLLAQADPLAKLSISGLSRIRLADTSTLLSEKKDSRQNLNKFLSVLGQLPDNIAELLSATYFTHIEASQQLAELAPNTVQIPES